MNNWSAGYVADIGYTFGYYQELNPLKVKLAFLNKGLVWREFGTACELGFGQGLSTNIHASASLVRWYGTDFNPAQARFAQEIAEAAGNNAQIYDEAFADFVARTDLPDFDFIGLHGIWSWISDENRALIVDFVRRKLKMGGVLYISYNTLPGWAAFAPMRHLMTEHAEVIGSEGRGIVNRINDAVEFASKLLETNPIFSVANPLVGTRVNSLKEQNRHYLAHEYFNRDWHPMHFATMAEWLEPAKLQYACSASYLDHLDHINFSEAQRQFMNDIPDPMFRESVRDFMVNQQFRKDYWVKGLRVRDVLDKSEAIRAHRVILATPRADVALKTTGPQGEITMNAEIYNPILDVIQDHKAISIGQIEAALKDKGINVLQVIEAVMLLTGAGHIHSVQDDKVIAKARTQTSALNSKLIQRSRGSADIAYLASPVIGGGILVGRIHQLFLLALSQGKKQPGELAQFAWDILSSQGQKLLKEGKMIEAIEENIAELTGQANAFEEKQLPILKALLIA